MFDINLVVLLIPVEYMRNRGAEGLHDLSRINIQELRYPAAFLRVTEVVLGRAFPHKRFRSSGLESSQEKGVEGLGNGSLKMQLTGGFVKKGKWARTAK